MKVFVVCLLVVVGLIGLSTADDDEHHSGANHHGKDAHSGEKSHDDSPGHMNEEPHSVTHSSEHPGGHDSHANHSGNDEAQWSDYKMEYGDTYSDPEEDKRHHDAWSASKEVVDNWAKIKEEEGLDFDVGMSDLSDETAEDLDDDPDDDDDDHEDHVDEMISDQPMDEPSSDHSDSPATHHESRRRRQANKSKPKPNPNPKPAPGKDKPKESKDKPAASSGKNSKLPESFDWREDGGVTPVKDIGRVSASWAFAAVEALETQIFKRTQRQEALSPETIINCCPTCYDIKVKGDRKDRRGHSMVGNVVKAVNFINEYTKQFGGLPTLAAEPFNSDPAAGTSCDKPLKEQTEYKRSVHKIKAKDEEDMKYHLYTFGPLIAKIHSSSNSFKNYNGDGVYNDGKQCLPKPAHFVVIVGYGTKTGDKGKKLDYWIVKHNKGKKNFNKGYIKIERGKNMCGIAMNVYVPIYPVV